MTAALATDVPPECVRLRVLWYSLRAGHAADAPGAAEWKEYAAAADEDGRRDEAAQARAAAACATSCAIVIREGDR